MKKLISLIVALAMVGSLAACGTSKPAETTAAATEATTEAVETLVYKYEEDHGSFKNTYTIELNADGTFQITEVAGPGQDVAIHTGSGYTLLDDSFETGAWDDEDSEKASFFSPIGACTWLITGDGLCEPENAGEEEASDGIQPGKYTYSEDRGDFNIEWEVMLMGNGSFKINEIHGLSGETTEHTGSTWTDNGDGTATTGEWDDKEVDKSEFFAPTGECTWKINDDGTCEPVGGEESGEASGSVNPGKYAYTEDKGDMQVKWEVLLMGNGNCRVDETMPSGDVVEHEAAGWTDNGDGTVKTGAWTDASADKSDFFAADGSCSWKINADGTCEPIK